MNDLQIFQNEEFGSIRTLEENGQIWFCGKDIAVALGYADTKKALIQHCKENGVVFYPLIDTLGRKQEAKFISEPNLYRLVCNSKLKSAEKFEEWVFEEVLPTIRKTGSYNNSNVYELNLKQIGLIVAEVVKEVIPMITKGVTDIEDKQIKKRKRRTHNRFESFPDEIKIAAEKIYYERNATYETISRFCCNNGYMISKSSIQRHFSREK